MNRITTVLLALGGAQGLGAQAPRVAHLPARPDAVLAPAPLAETRARPQPNPALRSLQRLLRAEQREAWHRRLDWELEERPQLQRELSAGIRKELSIELRRVFHIKLQAQLRHELPLRMRAAQQVERERPVELALLHQRIGDLRSFAARMQGQAVAPQLELELPAGRELQVLQQLLWAQAQRFEGAARAAGLPAQALPLAPVGQPELRSLYRQAKAMRLRSFDLAKALELEAPPERLPAAAAPPEARRVRELVELLLVMPQELSVGQLYASYDFMYAEVDAMLRQQDPHCRFRIDARLTAGAASAAELSAVVEQVRGLFARQLGVPLVKLARGASVADPATLGLQLQLCWLDFRALQQARGRQPAGPLPPARQDKDLGDCRRRVQALLHLCGQL